MAFARDIADRDAQRTARERQKIVVVAANAARGAAVAGAMSEWTRRRDVGRDGLGEPAVFERHAGLRGNRVQQVCIARRVGHFRFLGAETDEAEQLLVGCQRQQKLSVQAFQTGAAGVTFRHDHRRARAAQLSHGRRIAVDGKYHFIAGVLSPNLDVRIAQPFLSTAIDRNYAIAHLQPGGAGIIVEPHNGRPRAA